MIISASEKLIKMKIKNDQIEEYYNFLKVNATFKRSNVNVTKQGPITLT